MDNYSKYLCIFGGGAVRGYAYLGVLDAFEEFGFVPEKFAGSSVGAVFATFCAMGIQNDLLKQVLWDINFELFRDINFTFAPTFSISKGGVFLEWLRENIEKFYYKDAYKKGKNPPVCFKDLEKDLYLITTDLTNSKPFIFSKEYTPDFEIAQAVRASASLPGLLSPITYDGKLLADGDLMKSNPIWRLDKVLCPDDVRVLELRLEGTCSDSNIKNLGDYFNRIYACITNYSTDFIIDVYAGRDKFDYIKIDTKELALVNFNIDADTKKDVAKIGYDATMKFFKETLPEKRQFILYDYALLYQKLKQIERYLKRGNIFEAKKALGDMIMISADVKKTVDSLINKQIKCFRNVFNDNLTCGFWGKEKFVNKEQVNMELAKLKESLQNKCEELSK